LALQISARILKYFLALEKHLFRNMNTFLIIGRKKSLHFHMAV
jgi:hypothetical protein